MNKAFYTLLFFLTSITNFAYSQVKDPIKELHAKVVEFEKQEGNVNDMKLKRSSNKRTVTIATTSPVDSLLIVVKRNIKYHKSGTKKETVKFYKKPREKKELVLHVVRINGRANYIEYRETGEDYKKDPVLLTKEILIDNKYYQKTSYDISGDKQKEENLVNTTPDALSDR